MSLPVVHVVSDPSQAMPEQGTFVRLIREWIFISDLGYSEWSLHVQSRVGGQLMPDETKLTRIRIEKVISQLQNLEYMNVHVYMDLEAAQELLPLMCRPQVPFALAEPNPALRELCVKELSMNLRLGT